jgi:hypothetical protein
MRRLIVVPIASIVLASGCAGETGDTAPPPPSDRQSRGSKGPRGDSSGQAEAVARNLATAVKEVDGGILTDVTCEPRPTELKNSTQWECRCARREGTTSFPAVYSAQARSDGQINSFVLTQPR